MRSIVILAFCLLLPAVAVAADDDKEMHPQIAWTLYQLEDHSRAMEPLSVVDPETVEEKRYAAESLRQQATLLKKLADSIESLNAAWPADPEADGPFWNEKKKIELSEGAVLPGQRTKMTLAQVHEMLPKFGAWALSKATTVRMMAERLDPTPTEEAEEVAAN